MAKNFNLAAFITNFARIIDSQIKKVDAQCIAANKSTCDLLSDQGSFYCTILYIVRDRGEIKEIKSSCEILFEQNLDIISRDIGYISDCQRFEEGVVDVQELIESQYENALEYESAPRAPQVTSSNEEDSSAATSTNLMPEAELSDANNEVDFDDYSFFSHTAYVLGMIGNI